MEMILLPIVTKFQSLIPTFWFA